MSQAFHVSFGVQVAMDNWTSRQLSRHFESTETGKRATGPQIRLFLAGELAKGRKRLPMGEPCEGFSFETGCPGHETKQAKGAK